MKSTLRKDTKSLFLVGTMILFGSQLGQYVPTSKKIVALGGAEPKLIRVG